MYQAVVWRIEKKLIQSIRYISANLTSWYLMPIGYRTSFTFSKCVPALIHTCTLPLRCCRVWVLSRNHNLNFWFLYIHVCMYTSTYTYICTDITGIERMQREYICNWLVLGFFTFIIVQPSWVPNGQVAQCSLYHTEAVSLTKCNIILHSRY